ncbi:MAG: hypothetical protein OXE99_07360, partial [Cellvibrionales bacterium]|nr:hypothetical protein [Cellvibrionales bacterium]
ATIVAFHGARISLVGGAAVLAVMFVLLMPFIAIVTDFLKSADAEERACFFGGLGVGLAIMNVSGLAGTMLRWFGMAAGIGIPSNAAIQCF